MRLNIGCGKRRIPGYVGVDVVQRPGVEVVAPANDLPFPSGSVEEVMAIHLVEHFYPWEVPGLFREWARVMAPGAKLSVELPDVRKAARNLVDDLSIPGKHPDQLHLWGIFGDDTLRDPLMMHRSGWWFERLRPVVESAGFRSVCERETIYHPIGRGVRDFRLEAVRS